MMRTLREIRCREVIAIAAAALMASSAMAQPAAKPPEPPATETAASDGTPPDDGAAATPGEDDLPRLEDVPLPTYEEFLSPNRRDWVVLKDGRVLIVEPIYPRPNTITQIQAERDAILADSAKRFSEQGKKRLAELVSLSIFLPGEEESSEFRVKLDEIAEIRHHEDLMLRRIDALIESGDTRRAFELLFLVARTDPAWPGLDAREVRLQVADASRWLAEGQGERALTLIGALYERKPIPPEADNLLAEAASRLVGGAIDGERFREARFELSRIRQIDAGHQSINEWTNTLSERARSLQDDAEKAASAGDDARAAVLIDKAAWAWPKLGGLKPVHARLTSRYQRLLVGVPRLAADRPLILPTTADDRVRRLTTADLFEIDAFETVPGYRSVYFERWEPTDLGRRAQFELRPVLPAWASRPPLTSSEAIHLLRDRMTPGRPGFDARFADLVAGLRPLGPFGFEVEFRRIPLRAEAALLRPRSAAGTSVADDASNSDVFGRFLAGERQENRVAYRRARSETAEGPRHVAEIVEVAFPTYEVAVRALDRGEVRMLADVPTWDVPRLQEDKRFVLTKLALPATHVLQFHPGSEAFRTAELRRAVAVSADASRLLQLVAGQGAAESGRLVTAPYPSTHLGYDPLVKPRVVDLSLALALTLAAEQRFAGKIPEIVFVAPAEAPARQAAETLTATWKRIGLPVQLRTFDELKPGDRWDIAYRELSMADPVDELASLITLDPSVQVESLAELPDWLRQRLLDLDRAGDAATAQSILIDLHRQLHSDVRCVPLFEVDRFLVSRGAVRGMSERPVAVYQHAERWTLPTEYPEETP